MGCASSSLFNQDEEFSQIGSSGFAHHIVSLTSTTYGLLSLDDSPSLDRQSPAPSTPPPHRLLSDPRPLRSPLLPPPPKIVINSWELMDGLENDSTNSFGFSPLPSSNSHPSSILHKENSNPNLSGGPIDPSSLLKPQNDVTAADAANRPATQMSRDFPLQPALLDSFEKLCPPNGENRVVIYTTTLRGVRSTFEACNAVRSAIEAVGVLACERDMSMDRGFKEELRELLQGNERSSELVPPRVFVKGRYVGGAEEFLRLVDEGGLTSLLHGLPKLRPGSLCDGCGGVRFLPCFSCNGSCKVVILSPTTTTKTKITSTIARCADCNENGLVLCPICS